MYYGQLYELTITHKFPIPITEELLDECYSTRSEMKISTNKVMP